MKQILKDWLPGGEFSNEFPAAVTSVVEMKFESVDGGTVVTVKQSSIPSVDAKNEPILVSKIEEGWRKQLVEKMSEVYGF